MFTVCTMLLLEDTKNLSNNVELYIKQLRMNYFPKVGVSRHLLGRDLLWLVFWVVAYGRFDCTWKIMTKCNLIQIDWLMTLI